LTGLSLISIFALSKPKINYMKKIYLLSLVAVFAAGTVMAQRATYPGVYANPVNSKLHNNMPSFKGSSNRAVEGRWLCYAEQLDLYISTGMSEAAWLHVFPDSSIILGNDGTSNIYAWNHKAGTMIDPKNMPDYWLNPSSDYTLDSLAIGYAYIRYPGNANADTLLIEIFEHDPSLIYTLSGGGGTYQDILYTQSNNTVTSSQVIATYKYVLTDNDTTSFADFIEIATAGVPAQSNGDRIGVVVSFIPGYTWTLSDDLSSNKNVFYIFSSEHNGANTAPTFYGVLGDGNSDMNCSYALPIDVRYNMSTTGWNGYFIPTWAWQDGWGPEHHWIYFKLTSDNVGVDEMNGDFSEMSVYPNPAVDQAIVSFSMNQPTAQVNMEVLDVLGNKVFTAVKTTNGTANQQVTIDTRNFSAGTYFVTLTSEAGKVSKKLIVK
jgi:hypothetical protein